MQRLTLVPRQGWPERVEQNGLTYHTHEGGPYWDETTAYQLSAREVDVLEAAANALHALCLDAAQARGSEMSTCRPVTGSSTTPACARPLRGTTARRTG